MKISFCVPIYNRAHLVTKCLKSLVSQTMASDDYEIVVIDDCSTDATVDVVQTLFRENNVRHGQVITLPTNSGGPSMPRNVAAAHATGDYVFFVDSDDYVAPELAERVWEFGHANDSDLVYVKYGVEGVGRTPPQKFSSFGNLPRADIVEHGLMYALSVLKAFKRSEWNRLHTTFNPTLNRDEDTLVTTQFLVNTKTHSVLADQEYYIVVNHPEDRLTSIERPVSQTFEVWERILDTIYAASLGSLEDHHRIAAQYMNRIMWHEDGSDNAYLRRSSATYLTTEWMNNWHDLLSCHFPPEADPFVSPALRNKLSALRRGSRWAAQLAVSIEEMRDTHLQLARGLRWLFRNMIA